MSEPPHILLLVGEGQRKEGSSAFFSGKIHGFGNGETMQTLTMVRFWIEERY